MMKEDGSWQYERRRINEELGYGGCSTREGDNSFYDCSKDCKAPKLGYGEVVQFKIITIAN